VKAIAGAQGHFGHAREYRGTEPDPVTCGVFFLNVRDGIGNQLAELLRVDVGQRQSSTRVARARYGRVYATVA
jgi:hypothetical protein